MLLLLLPKLIWKACNLASLFDIQDRSGLAPEPVTAGLLVFPCRLFAGIGYLTDLFEKTVLATFLIDSESSFGGFLAIPSEPISTKNRVAKPLGVGIETSLSVSCASHLFDL